MSPRTQLTRGRTTSGISTCRCPYLLQPVWIGFLPLTTKKSWPIQRSQCLVFLFLWCKQCGFFGGKANEITTCIFLWCPERERFSFKKTTILDQEKIWAIISSEACIFLLEDTGKLRKNPELWQFHSRIPQLGSPGNPVCSRKLDFKTFTLSCKRIWPRDLHSHKKIITDSSAL